MPSTDLKLVSAVIVTIALSTGMMGEKFSLPALIRKGGGKNA
jgi:acid phosphatase family membrane protein YuiD